MIIGFQGIKNSYNDYATDEFIKRLKINIKNFTYNFGMRCKIFVE